MPIILHTKDEHVYYSTREGSVPATRTPGARGPRSRPNTQRVQKSTKQHQPLAPHSGSSEAPGPCSALPSAPPPRRLPRHSLSLQTSFLAQKVPLLPGLMEVVVHPTGQARQHISLAATRALEDPLFSSPSRNPRGSSLHGTEFTRMSPNPSHAPL